MNNQEKHPAGAALWLIGGRGIQLAVQLAMGLWIARYLGPSDYGLLSYAGACTGLLASVCQLGLPSTLVKELTDGPEQEGEILGTALVLRFFSSLLCTAGLLWFSARLGTGEPEKAAVVSLAALGMAAQIADSLHCWFQWRMRMAAAAAVLLAGCGAGTIWKLALLLRGKGVAWFALSAAVEHGATALLFLLVYRYQGGRRLCFSRVRALQLLSGSCHFILPGLLAGVYAQLDRILLGQLAGDAQVGLYATAVTLSGAWGFVLGAVIDAAYPGIAAAFRQDKALFARKNRQLYAVVFYLSAAAALGITILAEPAIRLLFGETYLGAVRPLQILAWSTAFSYLGVARNLWVVCEKVQQYLIWVYAAGAAVNAAMNLLLISGFGAAGTAAASLTAQMVTVLVVPFCIKPLRENGKWMLQAILLRSGEEKL